MNILITGATGFIGSSLLEQLLSLGHSISVVTRNTQKASESLSLLSLDIRVLDWKSINPERLAGVETVIHLAGSSISAFPWNEARKKLIYTSRVETTQQIVAALPPSCTTFVCASATGYYPSNEERSYDVSFRNLDPQSFLERVCVDWEHAAHKASSPSRRVVFLRSGLVLGQEKIGKILTRSTQLFGGVILGSGCQYMPLITLDAWIARCVMILSDASIIGPVNMVTRSITHEAYIRELSQKLQKRVRLRIPARLIRLLLGDFSVLILGSWRIESRDLS